MKKNPLVRTAKMVRNQIVRNKIKIFWGQKNRRSKNIKPDGVELFCGKIHHGITDQWKRLRFIFSWDHFWKLSSLQTSNSLHKGFEPVNSLDLVFPEESVVVVITTSSRQLLLDSFYQKKLYIYIKKFKKPSELRLWLVESSVIVHFCIITSMCDVVIINYQLFLY